MTPNTAPVCPPKGAASTGGASSSLPRLCDQIKPAIPAICAEVARVLKAKGY